MGSGIHTPSSTREILERLGHRPVRRLGQNFLIDGNIVRKSLQLAEIAAGDAVVEIGPGLGTLTAALLSAGCSVWAVERDPTLCRHLSKTLQARYPTTLHLLEGDALEHPLAGLDPAQHPDFKIVANLPYAISTPWMEAVLSGQLPRRMVLMLQQEAAQRYGAIPGSKAFGAISVFLSAAYRTLPGHRVAPACFYPRPEVESTLLVLQRRPHPRVFSAEARRVIRICFQQRRKQIASILRSSFPAEAEGWLGELEAAGVEPRTRPEDIPLEAWERLSASIQPHGREND